MSTLQEQIEARKDEAGRKGIQRKAETIARHLGVDRKPQDGSWHVFENSRLKIDVQDKCARHDEDYASTCTRIEYDGKAVYVWSGDTRLDDRTRFDGIVGLTSYIPGDWEQALDALCQLSEGRRASAEKAAETAKTAQTALDQEAERKRWGL